jgi:hypothetical protein
MLQHFDVPGLGMRTCAKLHGDFICIPSRVVNRLHLVREPAARNDTGTIVRAQATGAAYVCTRSHQDEADVHSTSVTLATITQRVLDASERVV